MALKQNGFFLCSHGDADIAKVLLDSGCSTSATNDFGSTPLHHACRYVLCCWLYKNTVAEEVL